jgi:NAD(P)-dependent dehydrogenase (short-subunit alcohol dehydrogenase family)
MQRVLITGANRGIGLEFTRHYLERGEQVFAGCRRPETATR